MQSIPKSVLESVQTANTAGTRLGTALQVLGVTLHAPGKALLRSVNARFCVGEVTAILGPNGAGKSSLMSVLTGQRQPTRGSVFMAGRPLARCEAADLARVRAFVAQEAQLAFDFSVREVVELGRYPHRKSPSPQENDIVRLAMQCTAVDHLAQRPVKMLSGGEKARVHLARALAQLWHPPQEGSALTDRWLMLDEPTAALDLKHQHSTLALLRRWATARQMGVVAVLHDLNLALRYCDQCVVLLDGGLVASGPTAKVLTAECIRLVWGIEALAVPRFGTAAGTVSDLQYVFTAQD